MKPKKTFPLRLPSAEIALRDNSGDGDEAKWNVIAVPGDFTHGQSGKFGLNAQVFAEMCLNFSRAGRDIVVDLEHQSEGEDPVPAQGWCKKLEVRADGKLWGLIEWVAETRAAILAGKWKYFSPAIRFGAKDDQGKPIGCVLSSVALTHSPFLSPSRGMQTVAASDTTDDEPVTTTPAAVLLADVLNENADLRKKTKKQKKKIEALELELVELREKVSASSEAEIGVLVDSAMAEHRLAETRRAGLTQLATQDRASFVLAFGAPVRARDAHLLRDVATGGRDAQVPSIGGPEGRSQATARKVDMSELPSVKELVDKYVAKGMGFEEAHIKAHDKIVRETKKLISRETAIQ